MVEGAEEEWRSICGLLLENYGMMMNVAEMETILEEMSKITSKAE